MLTDSSLLLLSIPLRPVRVVDLLSSGRNGIWGRRLYKCRSSLSISCHVVLVQHYKSLSTGNDHNLSPDGFGILFKGLDGWVALPPTLDVVDLLSRDTKLPRQLRLSHTFSANPNEALQNFGHEQLPSFRCR